MKPANRLRPFWHVAPDGSIRAPEQGSDTTALANARRHLAAALADACLAQRLLHEQFPVDEAVPLEVDRIGETLEAAIDELRFAAELLEE